jgi:cell division protein FtsX
MDMAEMTALLLVSLAVTGTLAAGLALMFWNARRLAGWTNWHRSS